MKSHNGPFVIQGDKTGEVGQESGSQPLKSAADDRWEFVMLYETHVRSVYGYYAARVGLDHAEDLTAEVFLRALRSYSSFDSSKSFRSWLFGIARTVAREFRRQCRITSNMTFEVGDLPDDANTSDAVENRLLTMQLLGTLNDQERDLIALRFQGGFSYREIGSLVGKREGAVRVQIHRILNRMRDRLETKHDSH